MNSITKMLNCFNLNLYYCSRKSFRNGSVCNFFRSLSSKPKNHYETLKLENDCTTKEIRDAFIALSKEYHPDKNKGDPKAQEQFVKVNEAYNVLIKPGSRRDYDITLNRFGGPSRVQNKDNFYEVHRYDYRDPWKDPSFARNRNFDDKYSKDYYGVRGLKKQSNQRILLWIMIVTGIGLFLQILLIRFSRLNIRQHLDKRSEENRRDMEHVRARAEFYNSRENQIEKAKERFNRSGTIVPEDEK